MTSSSYRLTHFLFLFELQEYRNLVLCVTYGSSSIFCEQKVDKVACKLSTQPYLWCYLGKAFLIECLINSSKLRYYCSHVYGPRVVSPGDTPAVDASKGKEVEVAEVRCGRGGLPREFGQRCYSRSKMIPLYSKID